MKLPFRARLIFDSIPLLLFALSMGLAQDFYSTGPYHISFFIPKSRIVEPIASGVIKQLQLTYPTNVTGPAPLIFMFNGMECRQEWYADTVNHVASWGYAVLQYTTKKSVPLLHSETVEMKYFEPLLKWLKRQDPELTKLMNFDHMAVMGHSRGGKLAALHYATRTDLTTAVLLDPVDCGDPVNKISHPSAIAKLVDLDMDCPFKNITPHNRSSKSAAVIGGGHKNRCSPEGTNYQAFMDTLSEDSWDVVIKGSHMQFTIGSGAWYEEVVLGCGSKGPLPNQVIINEAKTMAVAWFESVFRPSHATQLGLAAYKQQLRNKCNGGLVSYKLPDEACRGTVNEYVRNSLDGKMDLYTAV